MPCCPWFDAQFKTLRYDQRGAGLSEKVREPFTIDDHVSDLEAVVKHSGLPGPYYVAAVAAGAAIAIGFAHARPTQVRAAVLCAAATDVSEDRRSFLIERTELASTKGMRAVADATLACDLMHPRSAIIRQYLRITVRGCLATILFATGWRIWRFSTPVLTRPLPP